MSLLGAMNTADSGLTAQSAAFTNISDNIANSQTVGYKGVTTSFADYLTSSTASENMSGAVTTTPQYQNDVQGTITQSSDPLALAISGQGFFNVSETTGSTGTAFNGEQYYTRDGDFTQNTLGYLVNGSGEYLDGYSLNAQGVIDTGNLQPIQVNESPLPAEATSSVTYSATLPTSDGTSTTPTTPSDVSVYDSSGTSHDIAMTWTPVAGQTNTYTLSMSSPDVGGGSAFATATVAFDNGGSLASVTPGTGATGGGNTVGSAATLSVDPDFGSGAQPIAIELGTLGQTDGVAVSGSTYDLKTLAANGASVGNYTGVSMTSSGDVVASYDNDQTRVIAHVPLATFAAPDALQRQNGQAFTATAGSGAATLGNANQSGDGSLVTGSVESSNVDISTDLTRLISAQQAYGANAKIVTAANQMMQTTIAMIQ